VGRGLRWRSYAPDDNGFFPLEYADVYGVPFQFIPTAGNTKNLEIKKSWTVHAERDRADARITFPKLVGYRIELRDEPLFATFGEASTVTLTTADMPTETVVSGVIGSASTHTLEELRVKRDQED
jgi:type III restriction enzyme